MTRALIFDLGRVLIPFDFNRAYARMTARCGLPKEEIGRRLLADGLPAEYESGRIESAPFVRRVGELLGVTLEESEFRAIWGSIFLPETLIPEAFIERLAGRYPLVLLSNTNEMHYTFLRENYPILRHFHGYTLSHEVKAMKPEPAIYADAVGKTGCRPEECFFTDDVAEYVEGAKRFGIDAVQFQGFAALVEELRARAIQVD